MGSLSVLEKLNWRRVLLATPVCFSYFFSPLSLAASGVSLEATRLIYDEASKTASVVASNASQHSYLVQSWVENEKNEQTNDFFTVPPLFKLDSNKKNTVQVVKKVELPADQESLYWMNVNFVPPSNKEDINVIRFSINNKIKLIYRPDALKNVDFSEQVQRLDVSLNDNKVVVKNNTPYFINIAQWDMDGERLENPSYFSPGAESRTEYKKQKITNGVINIFYINDLGGVEAAAFKVLK